MHVRLLPLLSFFPLLLPAQEIQYAIKPDNTLSSISNFSEGLSRVQFWGSRNVSFIDTAGKAKAFIETYDDAGNFNDGLVWVAKEIKGKTLYGFMNKDGELVVPYQYDEVEDFSCNRTTVNKDGIWLIIDKDGRPVLNDSLLITEREVDDISAHTKRWEDVEPPAFHNNLMLVRNGGKYGYADTSGKIAIPCTFYNAFDFSGGAAVVAADTVNESLPYNGTGSLDSLYNSLPSGIPSYKWKIIDTAGRVLYEFKNDERPDLNQYFSDGYLSFADDKDRYGVMNQNGKIIIPSQYANEPFPFSDGATIVQVSNGKDEGNKNGYMKVIDTLGQTISKVSFSSHYGTMYDSRQQFHEGLMAVKIDDKWGYIDKNGNIIIPPQFSDVLDFCCRRAVVVTEDGKVAVLKNPLYMKRK